jgi:hypothetical protein
MRPGATRPTGRESAEPRLQPWEYALPVVREEHYHLDYLKGQVVGLAAELRATDCPAAITLWQRALARLADMKQAFDQERYRQALDDAIRLIEDARLLVAYPMEA